MTAPAAPSAFTGSIPDTYHRCLGPLLFEPYASDLASRVRSAANGMGPRILELACGTGIVTKALVGVVPPGATLLATDLNDAMLDIARRHVPPDPRLTFQRVDACSLPFPDASFDLLISQFGVMFFPDKPKAMREARRILAARGRYLFNVWESLAHNPIPATIHETVAAHFPDDPPKFLLTPYGYFDRHAIESTLRTAGFTDITCHTITVPTESPSAALAAQGLIEGTPMLMDLNQRGLTDTTALRAAATTRLADRFGDRPCRATMRAMVFDAA